MRRRERPIVWGWEVFWFAVGEFFSNFFDALLTISIFEFFEDIF